jgi:hypothetical protein
VSGILSCLIKCDREFGMWKLIGSCCDEVIGFPSEWSSRLKTMKDLTSQQYIEGGA